MKQQQEELAEKIEQLAIADTKIKVSLDLTWTLIIYMIVYV